MTERDHASATGESSTTAWTEVVRRVDALAPDPLDSEREQKAWLRASLTARASGGSTGGTPDVVTDRELADQAVDALYDVLLVLRDAPSEPSRGTHVEGPEAPMAARDTSPALRSRAKRLVHGAAGPAVRLQLDRLQRRLDRLENELQRSRVLQRRVAEVDDLVVELLLPAEEQDREVLLTALRRYRKASL